MLFSAGNSRTPAGLNAAPLQRRHRPDYWLLLIAVLLLGFGLVVVYSISPAFAAATQTSEKYFVSKQFMAGVVGLAAFAVCAKLPTSTFRNARNALLMLSTAAALIVQVFGREVNGASRWIQFGGFSFQSVELIKFALLFYLANLLAERMLRNELSSYKTTQPLLLAMLAIGFVVAILQSDLGSAGVMVAMILLMAFSAGVPIKRIGLLVAIALIGMVVAIAGSGYRRDRLSTYLNPAQDCQGAGYQSCQALIAIGSGGLFGLGLGRSVQAAGYTPEAANDSIFAILSEQFGFIGVSLLLALFALLFSRLKRIIETSRDIFNRLVVCGILAWLSTQLIINVGSMLGLLPLKGITLPFISYGGTSLIFVMAAMGVAFQISHYTAFRSSANEQKAERNGHDIGNVVRRGDRRPYYATLSRRP